MDEVDYLLTQLRKELEEIESDIFNCEAALAQQEQLLAAEGGAYAARCPILQNRLQIVRKEIESIGGQLRDISADLLPFAVAPELCLQLSKKLKQEIAIRQQQLTSELWNAKLPHIKNAFLSDSIWEDLGIPPDNRSKLTERLIEKLQITQQIGTINNEQIIHHLAEPEQERLQQWIAQVLQSIPQQTITLGNQLRELRGEQRRIEADLQRAPDDQVLAPIHDEISRLRELFPTGNEGAWH